MRFQVPQFIEVEDKIFGPLTVKQFIYLAGGAGLSFILYTYISAFSFILAVMALAPVLALSLALAFYKVNNRALIFVMESAFKYLFTNKLYIWKKTEKKPEPKTDGTPARQVYVPKISESKLKDLTWSLDINDNSALGVKETMRAASYENTNGNRYTK